MLTDVAEEHVACILSLEYTEQNTSVKADNTALYHKI
jgi:hypothetical protein